MIRRAEQREDLSADEAPKLNQHESKQTRLDGLERQVIGLEMPGIGR